MRAFHMTAASVLLAALPALMPVPSAWGHAVLLKSTPEGGAELSEAPPEIRAVFSEELAVKGSVMRLFDAGKHVLAVGGVDLKVQNHEEMRLIPPRLGPGTYEVQFYAISADDGFARSGGFKFSVRGAQ